MSAAIASPAVVACLVCGDACTTLYLDGADAPLHAAGIGSSRTSIAPGRILRCGGCGAGFRQTRTGHAELAALYRAMDAKVYDSEAAGRERTARRHLEIVKLHACKGRLLDVGCASGLFLLRAAASGWSVAGVEPCETLAREAGSRLEGRGAIHCATLETAGLKPGFDAVTMWDVLEHVPEPRAFLGSAARLLRPGGKLFLNVPDLDSLPARLLGARWPLLLAEHLNYFTRPSLRLLGESAGLKLVKFGRRMVWFSPEYVAYRAAQHGIPAAGTLRRLAAHLPRSLVVPVPMGETWGVWER